MKSIRNQYSSYTEGRNEEGQLHRENGPAIEYADGTKVWYYHGKLHREDGPAIESANGSKVWFYQDKIIDCCDSQQKFEKLLKLKAFW